MTGAADAVMPRVAAVLTGPRAAGAVVAAVGKANAGLTATPPDRVVAAVVTDVAGTFGNNALNIDPVAAPPGPLAKLAATIGAISGAVLAGIG